MKTHKFFYLKKTGQGYAPLIGCYCHKPISLSCAYDHLDAYSVVSSKYLFKSPFLQLLWNNHSDDTRYLYGNIAISIFKEYNLNSVKFVIYVIFNR